MMNCKKIIFVSLLFALFLPFISAHAQRPIFGGTPGQPTSGGSADCNGLTSGTGLQNPLKGGCSLYNLIKLVVNDVVLPIGGVVVVFFIIYGGFLMATSAGNEEKLKTAKKTVFWTLIGAAVLLGSWAIATAVENTIKQITAYHMTDKHTALALGAKTIK